MQVEQNLLDYIKFLGNSCLSIFVIEDIKIEDDKVYVYRSVFFIFSEVDDFILLFSGYEKFEKLDLFEFLWLKLFELCLLVVESNGVLIEGEESDVESYGNGFEFGEILVVFSGERNSFKVFSIVEGENKIFKSWCYLFSRFLVRFLMIFVKQQVLSDEELFEVLFIEEEVEEIEFWVKFFIYFWQMKFFNFVVE